MRRLSWLMLALALPLPAAAAPAIAAAEPARRSMDALIDSAQLWQARKRPDLARSVLQKVLAVQSDEPRALLMLGELELRAGSRNAALAPLAQLQASHPDSPELRQLQQLAQLHSSDLVRLNRLQQLREVGQLAEAARLARQMFPTGEAPGLLGAEMAGLIASTPGGWDISRRQMEARVARSGTAIDRLALAEVLALSPTTRKQAWTRLHGLVDEGVLPREIIASSWRRAIRLQPDDVAAGPLWDDYRGTMGEGVAPIGSTGNGRAAAAAVLPGGTAAEGASTAPRSAAKVAEKAAEKVAEKAAPRTASTAPEPPARDVALEAARREADRLLDIPENEQAAVLLADVLVRLGDDGRAWGLYGIARMRQGDHAAAVPAFDRALAGDPDDAARWRSLGLTSRYWAGVAEARRSAEAGDDAAVVALLDPLIDTQPEAIEGTLLLAGARARQGEDGAARQLYERVLALAPNEARAWRGLTALAMRRDPESALAMLAQRYGIGPAANDPDRPESAPQAPARAASAGPLDPADAVDTATVRRVVDQRRAEGRHGSALRLIEQALLLAPDETWLRYDTARIYADFRLPDIALAVMDEGLARNRQEPDLLQAAALIALAADAPRRAVEILDGLPVAIAQGPQRELVQRARRERALASAREAFLAQDIALTRVWLAEAEQLVDDRGRFVLASSTAGSSLSVSDAVVSDAVASEPWPNLRLARMRLATHETRAARDRLERLDPVALAPQVDALLEWARLNVDADQLATAYDGVQRALDAPAERTGWTPAERAEVLLAHAGLALDLDLNSTARADAEQVAMLLPDDAQEARLRLLRLQRRMGHALAARSTLDGLLARTPNDPLVRLEAARQARADADEGEALAHLDIARRRALPGSETALEIERVQDAIEAENQPFVEAAMHASRNPGSVGRGNLDSRETTARMTWPKIGQGQYFVHVDHLSLDAGALPTDIDNAGLLGRTLLSSPGGLAATSPQSARGAAIGAGWRGAGQEIDVGVVDLGVRNWLGGWRLSGDTGTLVWRVGLNRRLVTGSLLSMGGARDPVDGHAWGGVTLTALDGSISQDFDETHSLSTQVRVGLLRGQGVADNHTAQARVAYTRVISASTTHRSTLGATLTHWTYQRNLRYYTDGQGGYYSPQAYGSFSIPWVHEGMNGRLSWQLRLIASHSVSVEKETPYYPNDPAAQSASGNRLHGGGPGNGFGGSGRLLLEWRAAPDWAIGTALSAEKSSGYSPRQASVYLRHGLGRVPPPLGWPPEMLESYVRR
ncbi:cellulose synthase subunit BcsC-related outer membrane protein [Leptothrix discophora]|uniref:Cellulose synthase subunit BcsC-related outer membrane protein n=1 Tax=Leptothrix discophora TaxID=89 RepID=A0ABT9G177_LEPDI|nr:cellulose synthase subunit BcsC-related outer membrane protein [Leptothrix discophora]MDP4300239.1 cellulose synthase subunit BcsC-related outer membrane protein [Leptothrix discophora]